MRMCSIASGSSGNCIYVGSDHTHLLVDTGISKKRIEEGLKTLDLKGDDLNGILITHEHSDHIQGLGVFSRKYQIPIYATKGTLEGIKSYSGLGKMPEGLYHPTIQMSRLRWGILIFILLRFHMMRTNRRDTGWSAEQNQLLLQRISASMIRIQ